MEHTETHLCTEPLLLLGASGYLGRVLAAQVLVQSACTLRCPLRAHHDPDEVVRAIAAEHEDLTLEVVRERCTMLTLDGDLMQLQAPCEGVRGILHCAGSVSYFDRSALEAGNQQLTRAALALGEALEVEHFTYVSTAFASGYRCGPIAEQLHGEPSEDPTDYTASKRACEHLVAQSSLPWLIVRPSVVIGDSQTGCYSGRPYGIYQLWRGFERLLADEWQASAHAVHSDMPLPVVHQDAVADGLIAALRHFVPGRIVHLVSDPATLPTVREAWELWFSQVVQPETVHFHASVAAAEQHPMSTRQRLFLEFTATNLEIAEHDWNFETGALAELLPALPRADLASLLRCQRAFVAQSDRLKAYLADADHPVPEVDDVVSAC